MRRSNFICNFRAPDAEHFQVWETFKEAVKNRGLDICYVTLTLCEAWLSAVEGAKQIHQVVTPTQVVNLQQQNTFVYTVGKPRRESPMLNCPRKAYSRTLRGLAFQAYVMEKARDLDGSFSFRTFPELGHDFFRKCIVSLKKRGKVLALEPRSNPRFYILSEWRGHYPTMLENNGVKPRFTLDSAWSGE